jgi:hypothetical protein
VSQTVKTMEQIEIDLVRRALALRKRKKIGILLAADGRYWISDNIYDPHGSKVMLSLGALATMVEEAERAELRRPPVMETAVAFQKKGCA